MIKFLILLSSIVFSFQTIANDKKPKKIFNSEFTSVALDKSVDLRGMQAVGTLTLHQPRGSILVQVFKQAPCPDGERCQNRPQLIINREIPVLNVTTDKCKVTYYGSVSVEVKGQKIDLEASVADYSKAKCDDPVMRKINPKAPVYSWLVENIHVRRSPNPVRYVHQFIGKPFVEYKLR